MKFGHTIMYVPSVEKAIEFYEHGFGLKRKFLTEGKEYGELDTGETTLAFAANEIAKQFDFTLHPNEPANAPAAIEVAFTTHNVQSAYAKAISAGAAPAAEPVKKPWGQTVAYIRDLNGVLVEICTPMS